MLSLSVTGDINTYDIKHIEKIFFSENEVTINNTHFLKYDSERNSLIFTTETKYLGNVYKVVKCDDLISITDVKNDITFENCENFLEDFKYNQIIDNNATNKTISKMKEDTSNLIIDNNEPKTNLGGAFIALGGTFLLINNNKECDNCDTISDINNFSDDIKLTNNIGYILIIVGGIFIAMGI
tara:strand:+ start:536 stop:1084 length:549 start_codon:yes stop_codon:yes gene_type:complete